MNENKVEKYPYFYLKPSHLWQTSIADTVEPSPQQYQV